MAVTILESLMNADFNLRHNEQIGKSFAKMQLHNAVELLQKGYSIHDEVEPLLEEYGDVDKVPEKA